MRTDPAVTGAGSVSGRPEEDARWLTSMHSLCKSLTIISGSNSTYVRRCDEFNRTDPGASAETNETHVRVPPFLLLSQGTLLTADTDDALRIVEAAREILEKVDQELARRFDVLRLKDGRQRIEIVEEGYVVAFIRQVFKRDRPRQWQSLEITASDARSADGEIERSRERGGKRDERNDRRLLDMREEMNDEQDVSIRAQRPSVWAVDLSPFRPYFHCRGSRDQLDQPLDYAQTRLTEKDKRP